MQSKNNIFLGLYILLVLFDLACSSFENFSNFRVFSKPLLLFSLLIYFFIQARINRNTTFYLMMGALFCSLLGDVFLLFENRSGIFFTLGLASFLIAHLLFAITFSKKWHHKRPSHFWLIILLLLTYGGLLFCFLESSLGALKIPVILYILGILTMVITAYNRIGNVPQSSFNLVFIGALFFVLSDSVLAIDKFMFAIPQSNIIIMGTYATAQYLIMKGVLNQEIIEN